MTTSTVAPCATCRWRVLSTKTFERLANRVAQLSTSLSHIRILHTPGPDGLCPECKVPNCRTGQMAVDPRPLRLPWPRRAA